MRLQGRAAVPGAELLAQLPSRRQCRPVRFEMVLNLKSAKAIRLTVPASILSRADEVVE